MSRIASIIALCVLLSSARGIDDEAEHKYGNKIDGYVEGKQRMEPRSVLQFLTRLIGFDDDRARDQSLQNQPPALVARYVVNQADWAAGATISVREDIESFPVANLISIADGPVGNGTGIPYMYLTPLDYTAQDLAKDHRATLLVSLAQGNYCKAKEYDPMDPRCARVMLTGKIKALKNETKEHDIAKQLFFGRHPKLQNMPPSHNFFFAKLEILTVVVLHTFGGPKYVSVKDYFNPPNSLYRRGIASAF